MNNNFTVAPLSEQGCLKEHHVGMILACIAMTLCFFFGTLAHSWFLWLSLHAGRKIKPTQVFFINHTVLDLICCTECALEMLNVLIFNSDQFLGLIYFVSNLSCFGRPLMQTCICIEHYLAVRHPIIFLKYKGLQYRITLAVVVWLIAVAYSVYEVFTKTFPDPYFGFVFVTAVAVMSFCCVSVLLALKHPGPGDQQITVRRSRDVRNQQKSNAFKTIFSELLIILVFYLPSASLPFIAMIQLNKSFYYCDIVPFTQSLYLLGVIITPLLNGVPKYFNHQRGSNVDR